MHFFCSTCSAHTHQQRVETFFTSPPTTILSSQDFDSSTQPIFWVLDSPWNVSCTLSDCCTTFLGISYQFGRLFNLATAVVTTPTHLTINYVENQIQSSGTGSMSSLVICHSSCSLKPASRQSVGNTEIASLIHHNIIKIIKLS